MTAVVTESTVTGMLVRCELVDAVATITLASTANRNALSIALVDEVHNALDEAERAIAGDGVRAIVLTHEPPAFCSGADLKERAAGRIETKPVARLFRRLMDVAVPTIAAVDGPVRAGGIGLMASCDLVVLSSAVDLALTEVRVGVVAALISVPIFRRADPAALAAPMLTGEPISAAAARACGLVTHVSDDVAATTAELVAALRLGAPGAVAETKRLLADVLDARLGGADERDRLLEQRRIESDQLFKSPEGQEGMAAFAAKRKPSWQA